MGILLAFGYWLIASASPASVQAFMNNLSKQLCCTQRVGMISPRWLIGQAIVPLSSSLTGLEDAKKGKGKSKEPCQGDHRHYEITVHCKFRSSRGKGQGEY